MVDTVLLFVDRFQTSNIPNCRVFREAHSGIIDLNVCWIALAQYWINVLRSNQWIIIMMVQFCQVVCERILDFKYTKLQDFL